MRVLWVVLVIALASTAMSNPPTTAELQAVTEEPTTTFLDPVANGARSATPAEASALKLPERPTWLDAIAPGPRVWVIPRTDAIGRPAKAKRKSKPRK